MVYPLSYEELVLSLVHDNPFTFPFSMSLAWVFRCLSDHGGVLFSGYNKIGAGIRRPACGIFIQLQPRDVQSAQQRLCEFTETRPIRKACNLARPV